MRALLGLLALVALLGTEWSEVDARAAGRATPLMKSAHLSGHKLSHRRTMAETFCRSEADM
jgi:hypothetical protein